MTQLKEAIALVTGGTAGIGKEIAKQLALEGSKVAIFGRDSQRGEETVSEINALAGSEAVAFHQVDVADTASVKEKVAQILQTFGRIDILVNNAGITRDQLLMRMTENDWDDVMTINVKSCYNLCQAIVRPMIRARKGKIINISSVVGITGNVGQANYAASKGAIISFTKALAKELGPRGVCVNCITPGYVKTRMTDELTDEQKKQILEKIPLGRMGDPLDIAKAVLFLASSASDYITGQVLTVDGGMVMC